jgi:hypothetical protein
MSSWICRALDPCDYVARVPALRLLAVVTADPDEYERGLDDVLSHPQLREVVDGLARLAFAGLADSYRDPGLPDNYHDCHDDDSAVDTIRRELAVAEALAGL